MAKDPICNMEVDEETAEFESQYASQTYCVRSEPVLRHRPYCRAAAHG